MRKWTLKDACLLDVFGELPPAAHDKLARKLDENPAFRRTHDELSRDADILRSLPIHEPSALDRQRIPSQIKQALHRSLFQQQREKWTRRARLLIRRAALAGVCTSLLAVALIYALPRHPAMKTPLAGALPSAPSANPAQNGSAAGASSQTASAQPAEDAPFDDYFVADVSDSRDAAPQRGDGNTQPLRPY